MEKGTSRKAPFSEILSQVRIKYMNITIQSQMSKVAREKSAPYNLSHANEILLKYWELGRATRDEIRNLVSFNLDTNSGRFTESVNKNLLMPVGKNNGFVVYQLTEAGKEKVKQIMRGKK